MKSDASLKTIPVVIQTTSTNPEDIATSYELQANSYLKKPEEWDTFRNLVRSLNDFWITHAILPSYQEGERAIPRGKLTKS
jgi:CheY-like chemotaxis protein